MSQVCVHCNRSLLRRSTRSGFAEKFVYSLFGYYPWRCTYCKKREMVHDRGSVRGRGLRSSSAKR